MFVYSHSKIGVVNRNGSFFASYNQEIPVITTHKTKQDQDGIYYVIPNDEEGLLNKITFVLERKESFNRNVLTWNKVAEGYIENFK